MPAPEQNDALLQAILESSQRIEALLVALVEAQSSNMPPGWQRRFGGPVTSEAVTMALEGSTPAEVAEHMRNKGGRP